MAQGDLSLKPPLRGTQELWGPRPQPNPFSGSVCTLCPPPRSCPSLSPGCTPSPHSCPGAVCLCCLPGLSHTWEGLGCPRPPCRRESVLSGQGAPQNRPPVCPLGCGGHSPVPCLGEGPPAQQKGCPRGPGPASALPPPSRDRARAAPGTPWEPAELGGRSEGRSSLHLHSPPDNAARAAPISLRSQTGQRPSDQWPGTS